MCFVAEKSKDCFLGKAGKLRVNQKKKYAWIEGGITMPVEEAQEKQRLNTFTLLNKANKKLSEAVSSPEKFEKLIDDTGRRLNIGKTNLLLTHGVESDVASDTYFKQHGLQQDFSKLEGIHVIKPVYDKDGHMMMNEKGYPKFQVGKVYSVDEISRAFPEVSEQAQQIAKTRYRKQAKFEDRKNATYATFKEMNVYNPEWTKTWKKRPSADKLLQTKIARKMAMSYAGVNRQEFKFTADDLETLRNMDPKSIETMYSKAMNLARKVGREVDRKLSQEKSGPSQTQQRSYNNPNSQAPKVAQATQAMPMPARTQGRGR